MIFWVFALRLHQLVVLALSSCLLSRAYFGFENIREPFPSEVILPAELVLVEIQHIRAARPATPLRDPTWCSCLTGSDIAIWSLLPSRDLPRFDGSACLKTELLKWFPACLFPSGNVAASFPNALGFLRRIWHEAFSSRVISLGVLAPLSCNIAASFPMQLVFERIYSPLDFAYTEVKPAFLLVLRLQDPTLQCSPLNHHRNASVTGCKTSRHQLCQIHTYLRW